MSDETSTLMGRHESLGKPYPLWVERLLLLMAILAFVSFNSSVNQAVGHDVLGPFVAYIAYPLALLAAIEMVGRALQQSRAS